LKEGSKIIKQFTILTLCFVSWYLLLSSVAIQWQLSSLDKQSSLQDAKKKENTTLEIQLVEMNNNYLYFAFPQATCTSATKKQKTPKFMMYNGT